MTELEEGREFLENLNDMYELRIKDLEHDLKLTRDALEFYARENSYWSQRYRPSVISLDVGEQARHALKSLRIVKS